MRERFQRILSVLCALALMLGCLPLAAMAEGGDPNYVQYETRVICLEWKDGNNYDQIRPTGDLYASLAGFKTGALNEANGWTGEVSVPEGTGNDWEIDTPEGYTKGTPSTSNGITVIAFHHSVAATLPTVSATVKWDDSNDAGKIRPASVQLMLLGDGEPAGKPVTVKAPAWKATWKDLPARKPGASEDIVYTVQQLQTPEGYVSSVSGLEVTNTLQTATLSLSVSVTGAPEGSDLSGLKLKVDGPDPSMPRQLTYADVAGGSYSFGTVLPGAYLVTESNADTLVEGYTMDAPASKVADAVYVKAGESATLEFKYAYKLPEPIEEVETEYDPLSNIGNLSFEILGPDPRLPMTVHYEVFSYKEGEYEYELPNLAPGTYTVVERNAETLVKYYTLTSSSVAGMVVKVEPNKSTTAKLFNQYVPAPTPEPNAEFVDIPVTKTWNDNNNEHGNRPESVTVRLYADGVEVDSHVLTAAEGWKFTFTEKPRYREDNKTEIVYTVNEDVVAMYAVTINGYNLINNYQPEVTSVSVRKVWADNNNSRKTRPSSIAMKLSDGQKTVKVVILNDSNGWAATVDNLPTVVNGQPAKYSWSEQEVLGYTLSSVQQQGNTMVFTNSVWERPETPPKGKTPKTPGETWFTFEEYDTPLGVEIVINHVGDCFD